MNERKRVIAMSALLGALVIANIAFRMGGDGISTGLFSDETDLSEAYSARARRNMDMLESLPDLRFMEGNASYGEPAEDSRNPFIFGVDKQREREAAARMARLQAMREQADREAEEKAAEARAEAEAGPPEPEPVRFTGKVLGTMTDVASGVTRASIIIDNEYYAVTEGSVLPGGFRVVSVSEARVRLVYEPENREITIALESVARE